jgi:hypothetical protein
MFKVATAATALLRAAVTIPAQAVTVYSAAGASPAAIQPAVDSFRTLLGTLNPNSSAFFPGGRREINWDGVPDLLAAPNQMPADFFNVNSPRGVVFSTYGSGLQVSARGTSGTADALTDGLLIIRYLFGLRGPSLVAGAVDPAGTRNTAEVIEPYINALLP